MNILQQFVRTNRTKKTHTWVPPHAGGYRLVSPRRRSVGKVWGIAERRARARRGFGPAPGHVPFCSSGAGAHTSKTPFVRMREWRPGRLHGLRRSGRFCGRRGYVRRARARGRAGSSRRVARLADALSSMPPSCVPGAVAPRGGQVRRATRRPRGMGSLGDVGPRQHHVGARSGLSSGASAGADTHGRVRALRRPGAAAEGADGGAPRGAAEHLARRRLLRLRQAWPQVAARGAPGPYGPGYPGRLARPARDAPVACGAGGAVDAAALQRRGSRPQGARALPAEAARAVADARLLLQGRLPPAPLCPLATMTPAGVATAAIAFTLAATPAPALPSPLTLAFVSSPWRAHRLASTLPAVARATAVCFLRCECLRGRGVSRPRDPSRRWGARFSSHGCPAVFRGSQQVPQRRTDALFSMLSRPDVRATYDAAQPTTSVDPVGIVFRPEDLTGWLTADRALTGKAVLRCFLG